jgi:hypothetical protein
MQSEDDDMILNPSTYHADVRPAITQQNAIGWRQLISGRFGHEWSRIQDDYYARDRRQRGTKQQTERDTVAITIDNAHLDAMDENVEAA